MSALISLPQSSKTLDGAAYQIQQTAQQALDSASHAALRAVRCDFTNGVLLLRGTVGSYYHKQLAQEAVRNLEGVTKINNRISVDAGGRR